MAELFDNTLPLGLIEPIELQEEHVIGREIVPITLLGIFNPMSPTLTHFSLLRDNDSEIAYLLVISLNPFSQTRQLIARLDDNIESLAFYLPLLAGSQAKTLPKSLPSFMVCLTRGEYMRSHLAAATMEFLKSIPLTEPLSDTVSSYRKHAGDPWSRIPDFAPPTENDWNDWYDVVVNEDHFESEMRGIIDAWNGSITNLGVDLPYMSSKDLLA